MTAIQFSESARLYAKNKDLVDRMAQIFRKEAETFVRNDLTPAICAAMAPRQVRAHDTGGYVYWYIADEVGKSVPSVPCVYARLADEGFVNGTWTAWGYWQGATSPQQRATLRARAMSLAGGLGPEATLEEITNQHMFSVSVAVTAATTVQTIASVVAKLLDAISE